ncbi:MAG: hypothetical protein H6774_03300 [Pseudomonadales bacterium]|nr:hypothetical protein [Candidatus Woesebacteria bacterium]MCB9802090.1 hypothetical protein [Pseudomonadales bacterium]
MSNYVIGIDAGGTKTEALCATLDGEVVGRGFSGPSNLGTTSVGAASFSLKEAIRQATEGLADARVARMVVGLAGMDTPEEEKRAHEVFSQALHEYGINNLMLVNDTMIALKNGSDAQDAVIIISGTGSNCVGINSAGETKQAGGMDYLLTDQGSGYFIGRQVLREAVKSYDGRRTHSVLEELVAKHFSIPSLDHLKEQVYNPVLSKVEVAALAPLCSEAFDLGDVAAQEIFTHAKQELMLLLTTVVNGLQFSGAFDVVLGGSVTHIDHVQKYLKEQIVLKYPLAQVAIPEKPPVFGALKMALSTQQ